MSQSSKTESSEPTLLFRVADSQSDYEAADKLSQSVGLPRTTLRFPTLMAWKGQELLGFLGTRIEKNMIIAGPLVMAQSRRLIFTALRLCEAYEAAMLDMGIASFIFHTHTGSLLDRALKRYYPSMKPYATRGDHAFYVWRIDNERRSQGSTAVG